MTDYFGFLIVSFIAGAGLTFGVVSALYFHNGFKAFLASASASLKADTSTVIAEVKKL
jgi:hypothetical protein